LGVSPAFPDCRSSVILPADNNLHQSGSIAEFLRFPLVATT